MNIYSETMEKKGGEGREKKEERESGGGEIITSDSGTKLFQAWKRWCTQILSALR